VSGIDRDRDGVPDALQAQRQYYSYGHARNFGGVSVPLPSSEWSEYGRYRGAAAPYAPYTSVGYGRYGGNARAHTPSLDEKYAPPKDVPVFEGTGSYATWK